ncbi:MAG: restriction endonuclease subunit S [Mariprofundaceae bacterium]|nr:restriction endonuclease subunit S [Mariprofundaceae bacterium]
MREDWVECLLNELCTIYPGVGFPKDKQGKVDGHYPFYKVGDISKNVQAGNRFLHLCDNYINKGDIPNTENKVLPPNSITFAKIGEALKLNRRCITNKYSLVDNNAIGVKANGCLNDLYLYFYFLTIRLEKFSRATTVPSVRKSDIENIKLPLPPLPIQRAIVAKIEELFSALDKGIADLKKAQAQLKIYRQAVLKKAFEGELTKEWREKQLKPEKWKKQLLKNVSSLNPKPIKKKIPSDLEIQFLPMRLVEKVKNKIHLEETRNFQDVQKKSYTFFEEGDVLFAKVTPCMENGKIAIAKGLKNKMGYGSSEFYVFRVNEKLSNEYLFNFLVQEKFRSDSQHAMTGAVGLKRVPRKFLEDYEIPIPSIREQHQIVQEIESRLSVCDKVEQSIAESLEKAQALRQSILKKAFAGSLLSAAEIAVCKAAPDYEPASVLLEKMKAEKKK